MEAEDEVECSGGKRNGFQIGFDQQYAGEAVRCVVESTAAGGELARGGEGCGAVQGRGGKIYGEGRPTALGDEDRVLAGAAGEIESAGMRGRAGEQREGFDEERSGRRRTGGGFAVAGVPGLEVVGHVWRGTRKPGEMITQRPGERRGTQRKTGECRPCPLMSAEIDRTKGRLEAGATTG